MLLFKNTTMNLSTERTKQILKTVIFVGALVALFLPLVMNSNFFFPFIVVKNVFFRITVEIMLAAYVLLAAFDSRYRPKKDLVSVLFGGLFVASVVSAFFGLGFYRSFWGNYERMSGLFHFAHTLAYFYILLNTWRAEQEWHRLLTFSVFVSTIMSFVGLAQWLGIPFLLQSSGGSRLSGTVGNATFLAAYLLFNLFLTLLFLRNTKWFQTTFFATAVLVFDGYLLLAAGIYTLFPDTDWGFLSILKLPVVNQLVEYPRLLVPFLLFQAVVAVVWWQRHQRWTTQLLLAAVFVLQFFIFFNTQTRGAGLGFLVGIGIYAAAIAVKSKQTVVRAVSATLLVISLVAPFAIIAAKDTAIVKSIPTLARISTISFSDITTESRILTWQASWQGWTESVKSFLIGYGPGHYYYAFSKHFPVEIFKDAGSQIWFDQAHNVVFDYALTTGLLGLLLYLAAFGMAGYYLFRAYRKNGQLEEWLLVGLLVAYLFQNLFVFDTLNTDVILYLVLGYIIWRSVYQTVAEERPSVEQRVNIPIVGAVVAVVLVSLLAVNVKTLWANHLIYRGLSPRETERTVDAAYDNLQRAIDEAVVGRYEARQQLSNFAITLRRTEAVSPQFAQTVMDAATIELERSVAEEPFNVRHYLWLGSLYNAGAIFDPTRIDKAIALLEKAVDLSPTRPQIYFELGQAYAFKGDLDRAFVQFQKGVDLAPWVVDSHWNIVSLAIVTKRQDVVDRELETIKTLSGGLTAGDYQQMIQLYARISDTDQIIKLYEQLIALEPNNSNHYFSLARVYFQLGDGQKAQAAARAILESQPELRSQVDQFLAELAGQ